MQRLALVAVFCAAAVVAAACRPAPQVLVFSDLHFNPFSDPSLVGALQAADVSGWRSIFAGSPQKPFSAYRSDTNYPLLESALAAMQQAVPRPDLVLIAGDFMAHGFQSTFKKTAPDPSASALEVFTARTNQFLARELAAAFPEAQILPALGNNDSGCGDYMSEPSSPFLRAFAEAWAPVVGRRGSTPDFVATFSAAGHYTAMAPSLRARVGNQGIPAVSPIFGNNPAFVVLTLDARSRAITDYAVHTLTNLPAAGANAPGVWSKEYAF